MMKMIGVAALGLSGWLIGCGGQTKTGVTKAPPAGSLEDDQYKEAEKKDDEELPYNVDAEPLPTKGTARLEDSWWVTTDPCPPGSTLHGGVPPKALRVGCKTDKGKNVGHTTDFYSSGGKKEAGQYENHFAEGVWTLWDEEGRRMSESTYVHGSKEGLETIWYPDGKIKAQRPYKAGRRDGITYIWDDRVRLRTALTHSKGIKHGPEVFWTLRGTVHEVTHWENGKEK